MATRHNFMSDFQGKSWQKDKTKPNRFGEHSWNAAIAAGRNPNVVTTALQQQSKIGMQIGPNLQKIMAKHKGLTGPNLTKGHANNPLSMYQGPEGGMGINSYNRAKADGWSSQDIYDEIKTGRSGMELGPKALDEYLVDYKALSAQNQPAPAPAVTPLPDLTLTNTKIPSTPGTQTGQANVGAGYNALGIRSAGSTANTGGTSKTFGRNKRKWQDIQSQVSQGTLKNMTW